MNKKYRDNFLKAGQLAGEVRAYGKSLIKKGSSYNEVISKINQKIIELGAYPAFPPQIALNDVAAHFLAWPGKDIVFDDQVVKLDVGVCYEGAIGDCAVTIDLSGKFTGLVDAVEAALLAAENCLEVGFPIRNIGKIIAETISTHSFKPVKNLCGHGLGYHKVHTSPSIPNYDDGEKGTIKPGMSFAIEPFATNGKGLIYEQGKPAIFSQTMPRFRGSSNAKSLLSMIKTFKGLPFAIHDLLGGELNLAEVESGLKELEKSGVITGYPPLVEVLHGMVAQAENSVLVDNDGKVVITTRLSETH